MTVLELRITWLFYGYTLDIGPSYKEIGVQRNGVTYCIISVEGIDFRHKRVSKLSGVFLDLVEMTREFQDENYGR